MRLVIAAALVAGTVGRNGYVASFTGLSQVAGTRTLTLDPGNSEIARLAAGFTIMFWAKFHDMSPTNVGITVQLNHASNGNFMQPFAGMHGGWQFGVRDGASNSRPRGIALSVLTAVAPRCLHQRVVFDLR